MNNVLQHRGPNDEGIYVDDYVSLGHRRLSIIDLSEKGKEPMSNEDGSIWLTYNGEIYNFREIRERLENLGHRFKSKTDAEVIIHSYEEYGLKCVKKFNGIWAFCIYDSNKKIIFLSRDHIGMKPLYYYFDKKKFIFSSEIKGILEHNIERKLNLSSFNEFISMRYISHYETIFTDIYRMLPGESIIFDITDKKIIRQRYWGVEDFNERNIGYNMAKKIIEKELLRAVDMQLVADVPVGIFLSGGIDSSAIAAVTTKIKKHEKVKTFSIAFEYGGNVNELPYAKRVSDILGTEHKEYSIGPVSLDELRGILNFFDEPMADPAIIPLFYLSKNAVKEVSVVLSGDGADEMFAGYDQYRFIDIHNRIRFIPRILRRAFSQACPDFVFRKMYKYYDSLGEGGKKKIRDIVRLDNNFEVYFSLYQAFTNDERKNLLKNFNDLNFLNERKFLFKDMNSILKYDLKHQLAEGYLMKTDKTSMANSLEVRAPFLDYKLVEFAVTLPYSFKYKNGITKFILKDALRGYLPKDILYRKKQTFHVPIDEWILHELKDEFHEILSKENIKEHNLFNYQYISNIFNKFEKSKLYYAKQLWNLITFQIWYEKYILAAS